MNSLPMIKSLSQNNSIMEVQIEKPMDGPVYYLVVYILGIMYTIFGGINLFQEGLFSMRLFIGGIITAMGARFFNRVIIPRYQAWRIKRKSKRNDGDDLPDDQSEQK